MFNNSVKKILNATNIEKKEKYNILTFPTHERYQTQLCKTGHNFYEFNMSGQKKWNTEQSPFPPNYYSLPDNELFSHISYDFILSQSKFWQLQVASQITKIINAPIISLEHTTPLIGFDRPENINKLRSMIGNVNVFISEFSKNAWNINVDSHVINHGIDTEVFKPLDFIEKQDHILTVANDFVNRDYCLNYKGWKNITNNFKTVLIGNTPGLSVSAPLEVLIMEYNKCAVYLNTSKLSPIPMSLLEAMSCGCAVVSTETCDIPNIIQNGYNGYISNNENELKSYIDLLLKNEDKRKELGNNARKTILNKYSETEFIQNWNTIFSTTYEVFNQ